MPETDIPNPGSLNSFTEDLVSHGHCNEDADWYLGMYEFALSGLQRAIAEQNNRTSLEVHNPNFIPIQTNPILSLVAA